MPLFVITGASQGIGESIAVKLADEPDAKLALLSRTSAKLEAVAERCRTLGATAVPFPCDVTLESEVASTSRKIVDDLGVPDLLVNNAGVFLPGSIAETTLDDFNAQIETNLTSAFMVTRAFLKEMIERGSGTIFYMGSVASIRAYAGGGAYSIAKHGVLGLARAVREETKGHGIRVTALLPGATITPSWDGVDLPEERFMPPEDIASVVQETWRLSDRTVVEEIVIRPQLGDI